MAKQHAQPGGRRAEREPAVAGARVTTLEMGIPGSAAAPPPHAPAGHPGAGADAGTTLPTSLDLVTNAYSGPITVPQRVPLGESGIEVHPLALGAGRFGSTRDSAEAAEILDRFAALGGALIDTTDRFAAGRSERIVGEWAASRGTRDRMRLMTRVGRHPDHDGVARRSVTQAVEASLRRLGTDRIDLLAFHDDDPDVPLEESLGAVDALITAGKVLAIGASDLSPERLIEARVLAANGLPRFQVLCTRYNLMERRAFEGAPELVAHAQGLAVLPHSALAEGFLGGRVRRRSDLRRDTRGERQGRHLGRRGLRVLRVLDEIASAHDTDPAAVALAWLLARPTVVAPVAGVSRPEQVDALMGAASLVLHRSELVELDRASA